jgi:predicted  nucleic acid-binding Zn-ribbon protein
MQMMVGRSKILEISRNVPSAEAAPADIPEGEAMITAVKVGDVDPNIEPEQPDTALWQPESQEVWEDEVEATPRRWKPILIGTMLLLIFFGWSGFWGWAYQAELATFGSPQRIAELIGLWAVPTSLLALTWLLAMRLSSSEARRFGDVAALLRTESEALEARIKTVNGEISLARSFLAENARELESVGRASARNLTEAAEQLVAALTDSDQKAQLLERVSHAAVSNLEMLRNHLPVVTSAARDTTNQIGNAGNAATEQIQALKASFSTMNDAILATSTSMGELEQRATEASQTIGNATEEASAALTAATSESEQRTMALLSRLQAEVTNVERRLGEAAENIEALGHRNAQQLGEQIEQLRSSVSSVATAADQQDLQVTEIVGRLEASLVNSGEKLAAINSQAEQKFDALLTRIGSSINDCGDRLGNIDASATDRIAKLAFAINALSESSGELALNLTANEERAGMMLADAEKLMLALDTVSRELGDDIPAAFDQLRTRYTEHEGAVATLREESGALEAQATSLTRLLGDAELLLKSQRASVEALMASSGTSLAERQAEVDALSTSLNATHALIADVAATAEEQISGSLQRVAAATQEAAQSSKAIVETELADIGERLTEQNKALLAGAIDAQLASLGTAVNEAIGRNISLSEEAAQRVSAQLHSIQELTSNLEQRAAAAREQFDGIDDEAFARRIALLTESLNSAAIDVAKILSNEVTDTAWAAYLKGDRGVFTRRAVRLLDSGEARIIANHYDDDAEFRDHVNRYIHDFEAMMRVLLSTRDGNAIGVTLLSSDVGKLYVALAQAIDRLRN